MLPWVYEPPASRFAGHPLVFPLKEGEGWWLLRKKGGGMVGDGVSYNAVAVCWLGWYRKAQVRI